MQEHLCFRPGKAPASLIRKYFASDIRQQVIEALVPKHLQKQFEAENLNVVGTPVDEAGPVKATTFSPIHKDPPKFIDQSTKAALRLRIGEDHQGWKLTTIHGREVTMEKDKQAAVLTLPKPGGEQSSGEVHLVPVSAVTRQ